MSSQPVYFWRPDEQPYGIFSQWYDSPFEVDGVMYQSTEMWMMIQKAKLFGDEVCIGPVVNALSLLMVGRKSHSR